MSLLLNEYIKALKKHKFQEALNIEKQFIEKANLKPWNSRDFWIEKLTQVSI